MDLPSALDLAFLDLETPQAPLHVGWTLRFGGAAPSVAALRRHLSARLDAVPRFRRRLVAGGGGGAWVDDPRFALARHVFGASLGAPGGERELRDVAGMLLSVPLPRDRPLWRMTVLDGLAGGGFAIVGQAHHALVDGIAAVEVGMLLFGPGAGARDGRAPSGALGDDATPGDDEPEPLRAPGHDTARPDDEPRLRRAHAPDRPPAWTPAPAPSQAALLRATLGARLRAAAATARELPGAAGALGDAARAVESLARPTPTTALDRSASPRRAVAFGSVSLAEARAAGRRHGATINDVLLTATTLALRAELRRRDEPLDPLRALVPVNVRIGAAAALGNRISFVPVEGLPVGEPDPQRALQLIRARTAAAKDGGDASALESLARAADALPAAARRLLTRSAVRAVGFNLVVSNVPGPPMALSLLGRPLLAIHPMVPLLHGHALTIGAVSYDGRLRLGLAADASVVPGVETIARDVAAGFAALGADAAAATGVPQRAAANR